MKTLKRFLLYVMVLAVLLPLSYSQVAHVQFLGSQASRPESWLQSFKKIAEFTVSVPADFTQDTFFDTLFALAGAESLSEYFARQYVLSPTGELSVNVLASEPLLPGETKIALIYLLRESLSSQECLRFIADQNGQAPNIQGVFLIQDKLREVVPYNCWVIGLDDPNYLVKDSQAEPRVFRLALDKQNYWVGDFGYFNSSWGNKRNSGWRFCLLFFKNAN